MKPIMKIAAILLVMAACRAGGAHASCGSCGTEAPHEETTREEGRGLFEDKPLRSRELEMHDGYESQDGVPAQPRAPKRKSKYGIDPRGFKLRDEADEPSDEADEPSDEAADTPEATIPKEDKHRTIVPAPCDCEAVNCECPESKTVCTEIWTCADKNCGTDGSVHKCSCRERFCSEGKFTPPCGGTHPCECEGFGSENAPCPAETCRPICSKEIEGARLYTSDCGGAPFCQCAGKGQWCKVCGLQRLCKNKGQNRPCRADKYRKSECNCGCGFNDCQCKGGRKCRGLSKEVYCRCSESMSLGILGGRASSVKCSCKILTLCRTSSVKNYLPCNGMISCAQIGCKADHCAGAGPLNPEAVNACRMVCPSTKTDASDLTCGGHKTECDCAAAKNPEPGAAECKCGTSCLGCRLVPCCDNKNKYRCRCIRGWFGRGECKNCADLGATCSSNVSKGGRWDHCPVSGLGSCAQ